ncbi:SpoIIE family protein phosphatase [Streptomyces sp. NPDC056190]|uniref:SpoIIE family protein phosphatase n=1 Tax=Streptomyces sp. NPDC056190 TaxID=3345741 RepID=UPI0035DD2D04
MSPSDNPGLAPLAKERLGLLTTVGDGLSDEESLRFGLDQALVVLHGLGGLVHLGVPGGRELYLAAHTGLSQALLRGWPKVARDDTVPPARAVRENTMVWTDQHEPGPACLPAETGLVSVPLAGPGGPLGALTVLTTSRGEPEQEDQQLLEAVVQWTADRLWSGAAPRSSAPGWEWSRGSQPQAPCEKAEIGAWDWDLLTGAVIWDDRALSILGNAPETSDGRIDTWVSLIHSDDLPRVLARTDDAPRAAHEAYCVEYRVCRPDRTLRWVESLGRVVIDQHGAPVRLIGTLRDITDNRLAQETVNHALMHMSDGFLAMDTGWRITFINTRAEHLLGPAEHLLGSVPWEASPHLNELALEDACRRAITDRRQVSFDARWPADQRRFHIRLVPVPGGLTMFFTDITDARRREAEQAAAEETAAQRTVRIANLTRALAAAVSEQDAVDALTEHVPLLFNATGVSVWTQEGPCLVSSGAVGYDQEFLKLIESIPVQHNLPTYQALQTGVPTYFSSPEEFIRENPHMLGVPEASGKQAWAFMPMVTSGRSVGVLVVSYAQPHTFTTEERALYTALSGLGAQALERGRLYDIEHRRARQLQRALLPRDLPVLPTVTAAARYLPSGEGTEVGGDWYDVLPLSGERVALVVGDVMGHGLSEAVTMGRLRTAVHTFADLEWPPDEMFFHLNNLVSGLGDDFYATCLYAVYDATDGSCSVISAGHPPPAVVHPDGTVRFSEFPLNPPLGAASPPFDSGSLELAPGSLLGLYTDGLVKSPDRDLDVGMAQLAQHLAAAPAPAPAPQSASLATRLDATCDALISALLPAEQQTIDDAALLLASVHQLPPENIACWPLPTDPRAAGQAREYIRDQLARWAWRSK